MSDRIAARAFLASVAQEALDGHIRMVCPFCGGGSSSERSLVLTVDESEGAAYCCHRASCGESGKLGATSTRILGASRSKKAKASVAYNDDIVSANFLDYPCKRWRRAPRGNSPLNPCDIGLYTDPSISKEVWVLRDVWGARRGVQVRYTNADGRKVVRSYKDDSEYDSPLYHALTHSDAGVHGDKLLTRLWIVEDPLSAATVRSWGHSAIALCGTILHNDTLRDMEGFYGNGPREISVALDPGAEMAALKIKNQLDASFGCKIRLRYIVRDIKDMSISEARDLFQGVSP